MKRFFGSYAGGLLLVAVLFGQMPATGSTPTVEMRGIQGTAMVIDDHYASKNGVTFVKEFSGSAFCICSDGYFVTNNHVVEKCPVGGTLRLLTWEDRNYPYECEAKVVYKDPEMDLALVKSEEKFRLYPLAVAPGNASLVGMTVTVFGFPGGSRTGFMDTTDVAVDQAAGQVHLVRKRVISPRRSITSGRIIRVLSLDHFKAFESTASINQGSSGGPVLNARGQVVGVTVALNRRSGGAVAISATSLRRFLARPAIRDLVDPPRIRLHSTPIAFAHRFDPHRFVLSLVHEDGTPYRTTGTLKVKLALGDPLVQLPDIALKLSPTGICEILAVPILHQPTTVSLAVPEDDHLRYITLLDMELKMGERIVRLSQLTRIDTESDPYIELVDGTRIPGVVEELYRRYPELQDGHFSVKVSDITPKPHQVHYRVQFKLEGRFAGETSGTFELVGAPSTRFRD